MPEKIEVTSDSVTDDFVKILGRINAEYSPPTSDTDFKVDERVEYLSGMPYLGRVRSIVTGDSEVGTTYYVQLDESATPLAVTDVRRLRRPREDA